MTFDHSSASAFPLNLILDQLSAKYGETPDVIYAQMQNYIDESFAEKTGICRQFASLLQGFKPTVADMIRLLSDELCLKESLSELDIET
ncbi:MAG: hypothetical protein IKE58_08170 [Blautia sp.]|nr:hypothetical protein [Blautia sp.]